VTSVSSKACSRPRFHAAATPRLAPKAVTEIGRRAVTEWVNAQSRGDGIEFARDRDGSTLGRNALAYADAL